MANTKQPIIGKATMTHDGAICMPMQPATVQKGATGMQMQLASKPAPTSGQQTTASSKGSGSK